MTHNIPATAFITDMSKHPQHRPHFWVRLTTWNQADKKTKIVSQKRFYFHDYEGGREEALFWTQDWRNWEYELLLKKGSIRPRHSSPQKKPPCYTIPPGNNTLGRVGLLKITDFKKYQKKDGSITEQKHVYYAAAWVEYIEKNGQIIRRCPKKSFSVKKYGYKEAKKLASQYRTKIEKILNSKKHSALRDRYSAQKLSKKRIPHA